MRSESEIPCYVTVVHLTLFTRTVVCQCVRKYRKLGVIYVRSTKSGLVVGSEVRSVYNINGSGSKTHFSLAYPPPPSSISSTQVLAAYLKCLLPTRTVADSLVSSPALSSLSGGTPGRVTTWGGDGNNPGGRTPGWETTRADGSPGG
jgi:hypothetical protein